MLKKCKFQIVLALFLAFTIIGQSIYAEPPRKVEADALSDYQAQQREIQNEISALRNELAGAKSELNKFQSELAAVDAQVQENERLLAALQKQLSAAEKELDKANKELEESQETLAIQLDGFKTRLRENYINGEVS
ncbi:MAG: hypothetical protein OSJ64_05360, partial [Firmicutes bacterium]|nr:hypothetical protein [Bacillota bacterium]